MGIAYGLRNDFKSQLENHLAALKMRSELYDNKTHPDIICSLINVALSYHNLEDYQNEVKYLLDAYKMEKELFEREDYADDDLKECLNNLISAYAKLNDVENKTLYEQKLLEMEKRDSKLSANKEQVPEPDEQHASTSREMANLKLVAEPNTGSTSASLQNEQDPGSSTAVKPIIQWEAAEIEKWFAQNSIDSSINQKLKLNDGQQLKQLHSLVNESPEFIFNQLMQTTNATNNNGAADIDKNEIEKFVNSLKLLFAN